MKSQKGSTFERAICRTLSLWFSEGESDTIFWRSSGSGAMAKVRSKVGKSTFGQYGDIAAVHPSGLALTQCCILELKRGYKSWSPLDVLDAKPKGRATKPAKQKMLYVPKYKRQNTEVLNFHILKILKQYMKL